MGLGETVAGLAQSSQVWNKEIAKQLLAKVAAGKALQNVTYLLLQIGELCVENLESRIFKIYQKISGQILFPRGK